MKARKAKAFLKQLISLLRSDNELSRLRTLTGASESLLALSEIAPSLVEHHNNLRKAYPSLDSIDTLLASFSDVLNQPASLSLDLGCGEKPRNPFGAAEWFGVDIREDLESNILCANLATEAIPCKTGHFDYCTAFDVIEHIPRILPSAEGGTRFPFIELMNEIYRVLKPGGIFLHQTPAFPCKQSFQDPTHVNIITEDTFPYYFCEPNLYANKIGYGFTGKFELLYQGWLDTAWIVGVLKAIK